MKGIAYTCVKCQIFIFTSSKITRQTVSRYKLFYNFRVFLAWQREYIFGEFHRKNPGNPRKLLPLIIGHFSKNLTKCMLCHINSNFDLILDAIPKTQDRQCVFLAKSYSEKKYVFINLRKRKRAKTKKD